MQMRDMQMWAGKEKRSCLEHRRVAGEDFFAVEFRFCLYNLGCYFRTWALLNVSILRAFCLLKLDCPHVLSFPHSLPTAVRN